MKSLTIVTYPVYPPAYSGNPPEERILVIPTGRISDRKHRNVIRAARAMLQTPTTYLMKTTWTEPQGQANAIRQDREDRCDRDSPWTPLQVLPTRQGSP